MEYYYLNKTSSEVEFHRLCRVIENIFPKLEKEKLLIDIDNSLVQPYKSKDINITLINDLEDDMIYARADIDLGQYITTLN